MAILTLLHDRCQEKSNNSEFLSTPSLQFMFAEKQGICYNKNYAEAQAGHQFPAEIGDKLY